VFGWWWTPERPPFLCLHFLSPEHRTRREKLFRDNASSTHSHTLTLTHPHALTRRARSRLTQFPIISMHTLARPFCSC
jgi:hypothetical protein